MAFDPFDVSGDFTLRVGSVDFVLPTLDARVVLTPFLPGGAPVVTLIGGTRHMRAPQGWFVDVTLSWSDMAPEDYNSLMDAAAALGGLGAGSTATLYLKTAGSEPAVVCVPSLGDSVGLFFEEQIRVRSGSLVLLGHEAQADPPGWMKDTLS